MLKTVETLLVHDIIGQDSVLPRCIGGSPGPKVDWTLSVAIFTTGLHHTKSLFNHNL